MMHLMCEANCLHYQILMTLKGVLLQSPLIDKR